MYSFIIILQKKTPLIYVPEIVDLFKRVGNAMANRINTDNCLLFMECWGQLLLL